MQHISVTTSAHPQHKDITLLAVKGFLDTNTAPEFEKAFQSVLAEKKFNLIIDLRETSYISSAGWGIFVGEIKRIRTQKGDLFLVSMSPEVTDAYELLQFNTILKSFPNVEQAMEKGFKRSRGKKSVEKPVEAAPENTPEENSYKKNRIEMDFDEPLVEKGPQKSHWFLRILKPWTWF